MEFLFKYVNCVFKQGDNVWEGAVRPQVQCLLDATKIFFYADEHSDEFSDSIILWLWENNDLINNPDKMDEKFMEDVKKYKQLIDARE